MKKAVLFTCIAFTLAVCLQVPARAEELQYNSLKPDFDTLAGYYDTSRYGRVYFNSSDIDYSGNMTYNGDSYDYFDLNLQPGGIGSEWHNGSMTLSIPISFDEVTGYNTVDSISFDIGIWIEGYNPSWMYLYVAQFGSYYDDVNNTDITVLMSTQVKYELSHGRVYHCYAVRDANGSSVPIQLRGLNTLYLTFNFSGSPSSNQLRFLFGADNGVFSTVGDINESLVQANEEMQQKAQDVLDEVSVDPPEVSEISSILSDDLSVNQDNFDVIRVRSRSQFVAWLIGAGATSLGFAFIGYILYGKKA